MKLNTSLSLLYGALWVLFLPYVALVSVPFYEFIGFWSILITGFLYAPILIGMGYLVFRCGVGPPNAVQMLYVVYCFFVLARIFLTNASGEWYIRWDFSNTLAIYLVALAASLLSFVRLNRIDPAVAEKAFLAVLVGFVPLLVYAVYGVNPLDGARYLSRQARLFGGHSINANTFGLVAGFFVVAGTYYLVYQPRFQKRAISVAFAVIVLCTGLYCLVFSGSRGSLLSSLAVCSLIVWTRYGLLYGGAVVASVSSIALVPYVLFGDVVTRVRSIRRIFGAFDELAVEGSSIESRLFFYEVAFNELSSSLPRTLFGFNLGIPVTGSFVHNLYVEAFIIGGLVFGGLFCVLTVRMALNCFLELKNGGFRLLAAFMLFYLANLQGTGSFFQSMAFVAFFPIFLRSHRGRNFGPGSVESDNGGQRDKMWR